MINTLRTILCTIFVLTLCSCLGVQLSKPNLMRFEEENGLLVMEAESFYKQTKTDKRRWYLIDSPDVKPDVVRDGDPVHLENASGGAYIEVLPDTRHNHDEKLIAGENFIDKPGAMAVLHYKVKFNNPGRYYIWIRAFSSNSEDDAVHVGLDDIWPETSMRWRTLINYEWGWSRYRRYPPKVEHKGKPHLLAYIDVEKVGKRELQISMREDGFEMDKIVLTKDKSFEPKGLGPLNK